MAKTRKSPSPESSTQVEPTTDKARSRKRRERTQVNQAPRGKRRNPTNPDLPPNDNLNKHPDETYGDTEIPERNVDI